MSLILSNLHEIVFIISRDLIRVDARDDGYIFKFRPDIRELSNRWQYIYGEISHEMLPKKDMTLEAFYHQSLAEIKRLAIHFFISEDDVILEAWEIKSQ